MDALVQLGHEVVDVVAAPVVTVGPVLPPPVLDPRRVIRKIELADDLDGVAVPAPPHPAIARSGFAVWIEEIVEVHAVDIVSVHDVDDRRQYCFAGLRYPGIDPLLPTVAPNPVGMLARDMISGGPNAAVERRAKRIEPRMHLNPPRVCLAHHDGKGIVAWIDALMPRELGRPGRERRRVQRVAAQPHVEDDRVEPDRPRAVEQRDQLALLLLRRQAGTRRPVSIRGGAQPGSAEFPRNDRREDRAVAKGDTRHVARRALRYDALGARATRIAEEESGRGGE